MSQTIHAIFDSGVFRPLEPVDRPPRQLKEVMDEIGAQAEARGLTPEIVHSLLQDG